MPYRYRRRPSRRELSLEAELALVLGPGPNCTLSDAELRSEWQLHRDRIMERARPTSTPWAYERFETPNEVDAQTGAK